MAAFIMVVTHVSTQSRFGFKARLYRAQLAIKRPLLTVSGGHVDFQVVVGSEPLSAGGADARPLVRVSHLVFNQGLVSFETFAAGVAFEAARVVSFVLFKVVFAGEFLVAYFTFEALFSLQRFSLSFYSCIF